MNKPQEILTYGEMDVLEVLLKSLTPREEKVIKMRFGLGPGKAEHSLEEVGQHFEISSHEVRQIEARALAKLRHPLRSALLREYLEQSEKLRLDPEPIPVENIPVIEKVKKLTPELITYLQNHEEELDRVRWDVFEHLIAEFFVSWGFENVRLVGRDSMTSADIFATQMVNPIGVRINYFIEVKRRKNKVGVGIIDQVHGAMLNEKEKFGWHAAMIVSLTGFTDFKKYTRESLKLKGIELKDRENLLMWLKDYKQNKDGLWLPVPKVKI